MSITVYQEVATPIVPVEGLAGRIREALFSHGEQGVLYYLTEDFAGLFQDHRGLDPVTAVGQPVGLMLDRRFGLAKGDDLVDDAAVWSGSAEFTQLSGRTVKIHPAETGYPSMRVSLVRPMTGWVEIDFEVKTDDDHGGSSSAVRLNSISPSFGYNTIGRNKVIGPSNQGNISFTTYTGFSGTITLHSVREIPGNHASQSTTTARPTLQRDANGKLRLAFDGVDDFLQTTAIDFTGSNEVTVVAAFHKASDAAVGTVAEVAASPDEGWWLRAPPTTGGTVHSVLVRGATAQVVVASPSAYPAPTTNVVTVLSKLSPSSTSLSVDNGASTTSTADLGGGTFKNKALYLGRRFTTSGWLSGSVYGLVVVNRIAEPANAADFLASCAGITLPEIDGGAT